jgi:hypothetical protein
MNFNFYSSGGYNGFLNYQISQQLPPLGDFSGLPWELQVEIIRNSIGSNIPQSLAQMELISFDWRNYVLGTLWPRFVQSQFPAGSRAQATQALTYFNKPVTAKNIYRFITFVQSM